MRVAIANSTRVESRPVWARGLKLASSFIISILLVSRPVWARGLKRRDYIYEQIRLVAPRVGAWIETCGQCESCLKAKVAPRVGAWIETAGQVFGCVLCCVAPRVGAWIETNIKTIKHKDRNSRAPCGRVD